ncbi:MAG: outer membrane protein assembly factor BamD, partial [Pseudomonadota bacterium]
MLSSSDNDEQVSEEKPAETIFAEAKSALDNGNASRAATLFDEVERLYPTSQWAKRAVIMSAFAAYEGAQYDKAILAASRFLDFYPSDKDAPYAQYLIAVSHYDQIVDVGRDQRRTRQAMQALRELIARYPDSEYAREATLKLDLTMDHLAGKEMAVGRQYLKQGAYIGAINRFRTVVETYQTTRHVEEALHRLVEANLALGLTGEAQSAAAVLGHNFPGSDWYADSY